jgi:hypothetical protein
MRSSSSAGEFELAAHLSQSRLETEDSPWIRPELPAGQDP